MWREYPNLKTPLLYYGGKQNLADWIIRYIPKHKTYIEPFAGGLAVFFRRPYVKGSPCAINDKHKNIYNFWKQLRDNANELQRVLNGTLYSFEDFKECRSIFQGKKNATKLERARATFVVLNCSFSGDTHSWGRDKGNATLRSFNNKIPSINKLGMRLSEAHIENRDALEVIRCWDREDSFFYCDPPYPNSDQGFYKGYTLEDFNNLMKLLKTIKGKFIVSCYVINGMKIDKNFKIVHKKTFVHAAGGSKLNKPRVESLIMNY